MPTVIPLRPVARQQGGQVPNLWPASDWVDAVSLTANTAYAYVPRADSVGNVGTILRINATVGPLYINFDATATVPGATTTTGAASAMVHAELEPVLIVVPLATGTMSIICGSNSLVTIEAWR